MRNIDRIPEIFDDLDLDLLTMTDDEVDAFAYEAARSAEACNAVDTALVGPRQRASVVLEFPRRPRSGKRGLRPTIRPAA